MSVLWMNSGGDACVCGGWGWGERDTVSPHDISMPFCSWLGYWQAITVKQNTLVLSMNRDAAASVRINYNFYDCLLQSGEQFLPAVSPRAGPTMGRCYHGQVSHGQVSHGQVSPRAGVTMGRSHHGQVSHWQVPPRAGVTISRCRTIINIMFVMCQI